MRRIIIILVMCLFTFRLDAAFEEDNISVRGTSMGGALSALCDEVSTIFYNPASTGFIVPDSKIKANIQYANKFGIQDYNLYSGNLMFPKMSLFGMKMGLSFIYEGVSEIISEKRFRLSFGTGAVQLPPFTFIDKTLQTGVGFGINYYNLTASGYQITQNDTAVDSKSSIGFDGGLFVIKNDLQFSFVVKNIMISSSFDNVIKFRIGASYNFRNDGALISCDFEPVKGINDYKGIYPLFRIGFEKIIKEMLFLRIGLKDFKLNAGIGVKVKGFVMDYSYSTEEAGITHRLGLTVW